MRRTGASFSRAYITVTAALSVLCGKLALSDEPSGASKWYLDIGVGFLSYEGDEEVRDGFVSGLKLGYDYSDLWTFEGAAYVAPVLKENFRYHTEVRDGQEVKLRISRLDPDGTRGIDSTSAFGLAFDALCHFTRWERFDPYVALGVGCVWYADKLGDNNVDPAARVGLGFFYHFNDEWAVRVDGRGFFAGKDTEANGIVAASVVWNWGARIPPDYVVVKGPGDTDGDGLLDTEEKDINTDPYDPDTDKDRLTDGDEVKKFRTDPLNPDTDYDFLKDGDEVLTYKTNPLDRDTDKGGVCDGHEVIEDHTDPLNGSDDLVLYTLHMEFDTDKADIKPQYFPNIDKIAKVLKRNPEATAVIEGHADKRKTSESSYNMRLSKQRAQSVLEYLVRAGVGRSRLKAVGYGFTRQIAPNDPVNGNPQNRRVEVYIRGVTRAQADEAGEPSGK